MSSKAKLPYKPRWIQQVLWMVLLPLVVATALLLILRQFTIQTEEALYQEIAQANTIRELNHLISQWGTLQGCAILSEAGVKELRKDYSLEHNELNASIELQFYRVRKLNWRKRLKEERLQRLINIFLSGEPNEQFKLLRSETSSPNSGFIEKAKALMKINHLSSEAKSIVAAEWNEHECCCPRAKYVPITKLKAQVMAPAVIYRGSILLDEIKLVVPNNKEQRL